LAQLTADITRRLEQLNHQIDKNNERILVSFFPDDIHQAFSAVIVFALLVYAPQ
jgi:hypothetical protein